MLFTGIIRDTTERKRAEEALRESEQCFKGSFEDASIGMALVRIDGLVLQVNRSLRKIVGYSERELLRRPSRTSPIRMTWMPISSKYTAYSPARSALTRWRSGICVRRGT